MLWIYGRRGSGAVCDGPQSSIRSDHVKQECGPAELAMLIADVKFTWPFCTGVLPSNGLRCGNWKNKSQMHTRRPYAISHDRSRIRGGTKASRNRHAPAGLRTYIYEHLLAPYALRLCRKPL